MKSFKKHRLNHALERLHGKNEKKNSDNNNEMVTSSNESFEDNIDLNGMIKDEEEEEDDDVEIIDSITRDESNNPVNSSDSVHSKVITSSEMEITSQITGPVSGVGSIKVKVRK